MVIEAMGRKPAGSIAKQTLPGWPWQRNNEALALKRGARPQLRPANSALRSATTKLVRLPLESSGVDCQPTSRAGEPATSLRRPCYSIP
jgi:hypothetical protein